MHLLMKFQELVKVHIKGERTETNTMDKAWWRNLYQNWDDEQLKEKSQIFKYNFDHIVF